jgi:hypothetical protein
MLLTDFESKFRDARNGTAYATGKMQGHESIDVTISVTDQKDESYTLLDVVTEGEFSCGCPSRIDFRIQREFSAVEAEVYHQAEEAECANMGVGRVRCSTKRRERYLLLSWKNKMVTSKIIKQSNRRLKNEH